MIGCGTRGKVDTSRDGGGGYTPGISIVSGTKRPGGTGGGGGGGSGGTDDVGSNHSSRKEKTKG